MLKYRIISSLEKVFYEDNIEKFHKMGSFTAYKNQKLSLMDAAKEVSMTTDEFLAAAKEYTN